METGSVSFSIAMVRVRPEEQLWREATFFHSFDRKSEELGLIHESNSGFFFNQRSMQTKNTEKVRLDPQKVPSISNCGCPAAWWPLIIGKDLAVFSEA